MTAPERSAAIEDFLAAAGWAGAVRGPLAADASFRRYDRVTRGTARAVLMDAPPPMENAAAFLRIAERLIELGLSAPRPLHADTAAGLVLLEDFGDITFTRALAEGAEEAELYRLATVDHAVVIGQCDVHDRSHFDRIAHNHWAFDDVVHAEDAGLRIVE